MDISRGAYIAVKECLDVKEGEEVVVVTDEERYGIGKALADVSSALGAKTSLLIIQPTGRHGAEPPRHVGEAMAASDVFIAPTTYSLSHTDARRRATEAGARGATLPGVTKEMFLGPMTADYKEVARISEKLADILTRGKEVHITSPSGTDLWIDISGREAEPDTGLYHNPGEWGNLPAGEAYLAPKSAQGVLVIDSWGKEISRPSKVVIEDGRGVEFEGEAKKLERVLTEAGDCAFLVAELGIGTNPKARITGNVLEDEKVMGTIHIAFGDNASFPGGTNRCGVHEDVIVMGPTVEIDGRRIMEAGRLMV